MSSSRADAAHAADIFAFIVEFLEKKRLDVPPAIRAACPAERPLPPPEDVVAIGGLSVADDSSSGEEEVIESGRVGPASSTPPSTGAGDS